MVNDGTVVISPICDLLLSLGLCSCVHVQSARSNLSRYVIKN